jgi:hypothetical protein
VNATDHQNVSWKEWPARITASTAVPNDPPTCCMIRVTLLASGRARSPRPRTSRPDGLYLKYEITFEV